MKKEDAAYIMYKEGATQKEIAGMMKLSENTISNWAKKYNWKTKKVSQDLKYENSVQTIMGLIDYQVRVLDRRKNLWLDDDPNSTKLIERGDIDALQKLFTTIRRDAKKFSDYVHVIKELVTFIQVDNLDLAKKLTELCTEFLNEKRKVL